MSVPPGAKTEHDFDPTHCVARSVAKALAEYPSLKAGTIDRARKTISVATIDKTDPPRIAQRISSTLPLAQEPDSPRFSPLLAAARHCRPSVPPHPSSHRRHINP